jgi:hypothetical protein
LAHIYRGREGIGEQGSSPCGSLEGERENACASGLPPSSPLVHQGPSPLDRATHVKGRFLALVNLL